jgi:hypothetical protein
LPGRFSYSVSTTLPRDWVWALLADITNWPKFSDVYSNLHWAGTPWEAGSRLTGTLHYPIEVHGQYEIKACDPPKLIRYLSQTRESGFATETTIRLEALPEGAVIRVDAYVVGEPKVQGGAPEFRQKLTTRWFEESARFCDAQR